MTCIIFDPAVTIPGPIAWRHAPTIEDIRDALKAPVPHASEVSAVVARLWHSGLAEDAERRARRHETARGMGGWLRFGRTQRLYLYFDQLATTHRQAAEAGAK